MTSTSVSVLSKNICISDAHTGKISFVDEDLNFQKFIGSNVLGIDLFNMPYSAIWENQDSLFVADTFKRRILNINPKENKIISMYQYKDVHSADTNEHNKWLSTPQKPLGTEEYTERDNLSQTITLNFNQFNFNILWHPSYTQFNSYQETIFKTKKFKMLLNGSIGLFLTSEYYWIAAKNFEYNGSNFTVIGSPESSRWILLHKGITCPIEIGLDFWIKDNSLVSSRGKEVSLETLASNSLQRIEIFIQALKNGATPLVAIEDFLQIPDLSLKLESYFTSVNGKKFAQNLMKAQTTAEQQRIAKLFLQNSEKNTKLYFAEIAIASMIVYEPSEGKKVNRIFILSSLIIM
ncbi:MAG: hypothetical protein RCG15_01070 [Candidatus Rickettsia vulgarisii]